MKKVILFFIICFYGLNGYSQVNLSDNNVGPVFYPPTNPTNNNARNRRSAVINSKSENLTRFNSKIEKLSKKIATAKETNVTKKARAKAIKLMTQPDVVANSKLLSAVQEIYDSAVNKYNELIQGVDKNKAKAEAIAKTH